MKIIQKSGKFFISTEEVSKHFSMDLSFIHMILKSKSYLKEPKAFLMDIDEVLINKDAIEILFKDLEKFSLDDEFSWKARTFVNHFNDSLNKLLRKKMLKKVPGFNGKSDESIIDSILKEKRIKYEKNIIGGF